MKNIILLATFTLAFFPLLCAQIVDVYVDKNNVPTTVIEKEADTDELEVLSTLNIDDYEVSDVVFIKDAAQLEEMFGKQNKEENKAKTTNNTRQVKETYTPPASRERNPIGEKVKRKRKRTPRWKSDRRAKRSSFACFEF